MTLFWKTTAALLAGLSLAAISHAAHAEVRAENAWSRATPPGAGTGAVYVTLTSSDGDRLVGTSSPAAQAAQVHSMTMDGNVMRMREVQGGLELPAGKSVALQPGGYHIMLVGLKAPLRRGQTVQVHLTFAKSPPVDITAPIAAVGASSPPGAAPQPAMPGMKMP